MTPKIQHTRGRIDAIKPKSHKINSARKEIEIIYCEKCKIPLTEKLVRWIQAENGENKPYCFFCHRRMLKKLNSQQEVKQNGI